ncbi:MAG: hypothetical protein H6Q68_3076 [Firmicutes bacterium]|nr:hypothetical protein [Bacillota bacterium]
MFRNGSRLLASCVLASVILSGSHTVFASGDIDVSYRYWKPTFSAKVGPAESGGVTVPWVDAKSQLGVASRSINDLRLSWQLTENSKVQIDSFSTSLHGTGTPNFKMGSWDLSVGKFKTDVDFKDLQVSWVKYTNEYAGGDIRHGYTLGLRNVRINAVSNQIDGTEHFTKDFNIIFPTVGLVFETNRESRISGFASLSGAYAGSKGHFYDAELGGKSFIDDQKSLSVTAGYRILKIKANKDNGDKLDTRINGPFFGVEKNF